jgi:hypothetical protein
VFARLVYASFLLCLPALLVVGLVFVVVPGGFIVALSALYYASVGFIGLVGMAAASRGRPGSSRGRPAEVSVGNASRLARSSLGPRGAVAAKTVSVVFSNDHGVASAPNQALTRPASGEFDSTVLLAPGAAPHRQDGARAV